MAERPILFRAPMVRAIQRHENPKTQTRRIVTPQPANGWHFETPPSIGRITSPHPKRGRFGAFIRRGLGTDFPEMDLIPCPYGMPGDRLWVRETWRRDPLHEDKALYRATDGDRTVFDKWTPSIHMPRWASRITLEVTGVRVERLQDISEADVIAEGIQRWPLGFRVEETGAPTHRSSSFETAVGAYRWLWESINGPGSWDANPWVWCVEFKRIGQSLGEGESKT